jgi:hypothetical protein
MYHVKYRDSFKKLVILAGRSDFADAKSEAEDCVTAGHDEVEILVDVRTADANMRGAVASLRQRLYLPERDDGTQAPPPPLR